MLYGVETECSLTPSIPKNPEAIVKWIIDVAGRGLVGGRVEEPLLVLGVSLLQRAGLLLLPLLEVPHRLHRGLLPRRGPRVVIHIVNAASAVPATLPAVWKMEILELLDIHIATWINAETLVEIKCMTYCSSYKC